MRMGRTGLTLIAALLLGACAPGLAPTPAASDATRTPRPTAAPTAIPLSLSSQSSPDGLWLAEAAMQGPWTEGAQEVYRASLTLRSTQTEIVWTVADETSTYGLGYTTPEVFRWSRDGRWLYYGHAPVPDGCALFVNFEDLYRFDLERGTSTELLPPARSLVIGMAPDELTLAFIEWRQAPELVLRDLSTRHERRVSLGTAQEDQAGGMIWSPDGGALVVTVAHKPCLPPDWSHSILWVNLTTLETRLLLDHDVRRPIAAEWTDPARILLWDESGAGWALDPVGGGLTPMP